MSICGCNLEMFTLMINQCTLKQEIAHLKALATEAILMAMATPKTLVWILDNHDRENQILIKHARCNQDELRSTSSVKQQSLSQG